jgi:hypothetical protein
MTEELTGKLDITKDNPERVAEIAKKLLSA